MKVLFLDIDGVLNSHRSIYALGGCPHGFAISQMKMFDMVALGLIQRLCRMGSIRVVVSSTWRMGRTVEQLATGLSLPVIGVTGEDHNGHRGSQIKEWLDQNPGVTHYAIVDDDSDMLDEQLPFFVRTRLEDGLSFGNYKHLARLLQVNDK